MQRPNPWILFMGGIALLNVAMLVGGLHAPAWQRYAGMAVCAAMGICSMTLGVLQYRKKKPERQRFVSKKPKPR